MSRAPLFDDRTRNDRAYKRADETLYGFLDRVSRPELAAPRSILNNWFDRWPVDSRDDLRARFVSKDPAGFNGAFWELYLHEAHVRLGFTIERDPKVSTRRTRPDFLMQRHDGAFYLEATVVGFPSSVINQRRREQRVTDAVNEAYHPDFALRLEQIAVGAQQPPRRMIVAAVERWLATLDWETERARINDSRRDPVHLEVRGTHLFVAPWPRAPEVRGDPTFQTIATYPGQGGVLNEPPMILDDLRDKASKFGQLDKPYVIAILCLRDFVTESDVEQALFGPEVVTVTVGPEGPIGDARLDRQPRGFWQHDERKRATRVSAVLSAIHLNPWSLTRAVPRLWLNPWAARPTQARLPWALTKGDLAANRLVTEPPAVDVHALFDLPAG